MKTQCFIRRTFCICLLVGLSHAARLAAQEQAAPLPDDFAFSKLLTNEIPKGSIASDFFPLLPAGSTLIFSGRHFHAFAANGDAIGGLGFGGLGVEADIPLPIEAERGRMKSWSEERFLKTRLGSVTLFCEVTPPTRTSEARASVSGIAPLDEVEKWTRGGGTKFLWRPQTAACYRAGRLLGVWDQGTRSFRAAKPDEAPPTLNAANLRTAAVEGLPSPERVWTDVQGRQIKARVMSYDAAARTVELKLSSQGTKVSGFALDKLSPEDQVCVLVASEARPPELPKVRR